MKKTIALFFAAMVCTLTASAQFQEGKGYIGASLTGLYLHYNGNDDFNIGLQAQGGYLFADNLLGYGQVALQTSANKAVADRYSVGVGLRYYLEDNGLFFGAGGKWVHANHSYNDIMPTVEVGYAYFINRSVTIEPALYYEQSFRDHSDYSTFGLRLGLGIYLFDD